MMEAWRGNFREKVESTLKNLLKHLNVLNYNSVIVVSWDRRIGCD